MAEAAAAPLRTGVRTIASAGTTPENGPSCDHVHGGVRSMAESSVYKVIELVGVSDESWEEATRAAVATASKTLRDLRVAEVVKLDVTIDDNKVSRFRSRLSVSFKYED
jgi:dodecin